MRTLLCFAHGVPGHWEAICFDYDLAVAGTSFDDVKTRLRDMIDSYVEAASNEPDERMRAYLLARRTPALVRARYMLRYIASAALNLVLLRKRDKAEEEGTFQLPCPA